MALGMIAAAAVSRPILALLVEALGAFEPSSCAVRAVVAIGAGGVVSVANRREDGVSTTAETEVDC